MEVYILVLTIVGSFLVGMKIKSKCITKNCECSIERQETNDEVLRTIRIGRRGLRPSQSQGSI